jgi:glyoxylate carboligase
MVIAVDAGEEFGENEAVFIVLRLFGAGCAPREQRRPKECRGRRHTERAPHHRTAAVALQDNVAYGIGRRRAQRHIVVGFIGLCAVAEAVRFSHMPYRS